MTVTVTPEALALVFARNIREYLTPEQMTECNERNRASTDPLVCHSHDHHDANMSMIAAYAEAAGVSEDEFELDDTTDVMNAAWEIAKKAEFYVDDEQRLCAELAEFCKVEGLFHKSADELYASLADVDSMAAVRQRAWLGDYCERWDAAVGG